MSEVVGRVESPKEIVGSIEGDGEMSVRVENLVKVPTAAEHEKLRHRDWPEQHPISAITGLEDELADKISESDISLINCGTSTEVI